MGPVIPIQRRRSFRSGVMFTVEEMGSRRKSIGFRADLKF